MSLQSLTDKARNRAVARVCKFEVIADDDALAALNDAEKAVQEAESALRFARDAEESGNGKRGRLSKPGAVAEAEQKLADAEAALTAATEAADAETLVLHFRGVLPKKLNEIRDRHADDDGRVNLLKCGTDLAREGFINITSKAGDDLGLTFDEVWEGALNGGEQESVSNLVVNHNFGAAKIGRAHV